MGLRFTRKREEAVIEPAWMKVEDARRQAYADAIAELDAQIIAKRKAQREAQEQVLPPKSGQLSKVSAKSLAKEYVLLHNRTNTSKKLSATDQLLLARRLQTLGAKWHTALNGEGREFAALTAKYKRMSR